MQTTLSIDRSAPAPGPFDDVRGLFDPSLIVMDAVCATKTDAIHQAVNLLHSSGRTEQPAEIEQSLWRREAASSTALVHGFAIPHCSSSAVGSDCLVVLKLRSPVDWGVPDHQPVRLIFLMVVRETRPAQAHLKMLAHLGRKLTDDAFRKRIFLAADPAALCALLESSTV